MHLLLIGVNHHTAALALRERLAFTREECASVLTHIGAASWCEEAMLLTTCNRTEFYVVSPTPSLVESGLRDIVHLLRGDDLLAPGAHRYHLEEASAARHLFRVACGLDSMVLGDVQILGQVKEACGQARTEGLVGPLLDRLFDRALRAGKRARHETAIGTGVTSIASAAVELLRQGLGDLTQRRVAVVGAGKTGRLLVHHLAHHQTAAISILNRSVASAESLAADTGARAHALDRLPDILVAADAVVCATRAPGAVIPAAWVESAMRDRAGRPLLMLDLAVPRDVEPAAATIAGVTLLSIDAIERVVDGNLARRVSEVPAVEHIVDEELARFESWRRSLGVTPLLRELRAHFEQVRNEELDRLLKHAPSDERHRAERLTRALINKLLHHPTISIRDADPSSETGRWQLEAARELFALGRKASRRGARRES